MPRVANPEHHASAVFVALWPDRGRMNNFDCDRPRQGRLSGRQNSYWNAVRLHGRQSGRHTRNRLFRESRRKADPADAEPVQQIGQSIEVIQIGMRDEYLINAMDYAVCERYLTTALMQE